MLPRLGQAQRRSYSANGLQPMASSTAPTTRLFLSKNTYALLRQRHEYPIRFRIHGEGLGPLYRGDVFHPGIAAGVDDPQHGAPRVVARSEVVPAVTRVKPDLVRAADLGQCDDHLSGLCVKNDAAGVLFLPASHEKLLVGTKGEAVGVHKAIGKVFRTFMVFGSITRIAPPG